jgi:sugar lactone lactonase YvrE
VALPPCAAGDDGVRALPGFSGAPAALVVRGRILVGRGPEHVTDDGAGGLLTGLADGRVLRVDTSARRVTEVGRTGGRPLGLTVLPDGCLLVCDASRGLLAMRPGRPVKVLTDRVEGEPLRMCSNVTAARDGTVYFTASSRRYRLAHWRSDLVEHTGTGRLMRLSPGGSPEVLADGIEFANGVALSRDESHVVVAETGTRRLTRHWLAGPAAGRSDVLLDNLPGYPDNLSRGPDGTLWVALAAPVNPLVEWGRGAPSWVRRTAGATAIALRVRPPRRARVLAVTADGVVRHDVTVSGPGCRMLTSVAETPDSLVLGSLSENSLTLCALPGS